MTENAEQIELLKGKRTTLRSSVTKLINKIEAELKKTDVTEENDIELYMETLNDKFESLKLTDSNLEKILSLKDIDKELESAEEYREKLVTYRFKASKYIRNLNQTLKTIEGFSISSENYAKAVTLLEQRFGRKETLVNTQMSQLLEIPPLKRSNDVKSFRQLFDKIQIHIRSLESLGIKSDTFSTLLSPVILKSLTSDLVFKFNKKFGDKYSLSDLIDLLNRQLIAKEKTELRLAKEKPLLSQNVNHLNWPRAKVKTQNERTKNPTANELFIYENTSKSKLCLFCDEPSHSSINCDYGRSLPIEKRKSILIKKGSCFRCIKSGHVSSLCRARLKCTKCGKRHLDIMCYGENKRSDNEKPESKEVTENTTLANNSCSREVYLQTLSAYIKENNLKHFIRVIIDMGSQCSYISKFTARKMKLKGLGEKCVNHGLFGGIEHAETHQRSRINLSNVDGSYNFELDEKKICASLPKMNDAHCLNQLKDMGILISDASINERSCLCKKNPGEIHLLIGADYAGKLLTGNIKHLSGSLVAVRTLLGWTVMGKSDIINTNKSSSLLVLSLHVNNAKISDLWNFDSLGIKEDRGKRTKTETQELDLEHFRETVNRDNTGRYKVNLPWLDGHPPLHDNKELAQKRLKHTVKSLKSKNRLNEYQEVFNQWENEGIIEQINPDKVNPEGLGMHYLPHRAVFKDNSTTKVRPVFDGSAKTRNSISINECIEKGPNLIEMIPAILNRFKWGKIGVISDIKQAFLQIALNESDRDVLWFMWWKDGDPKNIVTYRYCRVVFGISCSPFLLAALLNHVLDQVEEPLRSLAVKLKDSLYVDNCVASVDSVSELEHFRTETQRILKTAKFDLRGWKNNFLPEIEEAV
ncbi:hypothetical protein AVEN_248708-1 [Araneus ventricosus]|uniref:Reverse transcriptase domain-containing protein n=1 Tax=Araneus ventricosus TaxID=182803 RepID=A0A4Y2PAZ5_ARAVE|nr:hypothetical protein AVEN_248708-1 [Araneus ventricosus]